MNCTNKQQETCDVEKRGCKGCYYENDNKNQKSIEKLLNELKSENAALKEQLKMFIPRRRVRRAYKMIKKILEQDLQSNHKEHLERLKIFINKIEKEGTQIADKRTKESIEDLLSIVDIEYKVKE